MVGKFTQLLANMLPSQYREFADYPGFWERVELTVLHLPLLAVLVVLLLILSSRKYACCRECIMRVMVSITLLLPWVVRVLFDYAYDTPVGVLCFVGDMSVICMVSHYVGKKVFGKDGTVTCIVSGMACLVVASAMLVLFRVNSLFSIPSRSLHLLVSLWAVWHSFKIDWTQEVLERISKQHCFIALVCVLPFIPNIFTAGVPDADITSMTEITGYLFQGQNLLSVSSGVGDEMFSVAYPAGLPALMWLHSHLLNIRASESALLLWVMSYPLVVFSLIRLARLLGMNIYIVALFSLNLTLTGMFGLAGGQVQELLVYALGIEVVIASIQEKRLRAGFCLGAGMLMHPVVALPFFMMFVFGCLAVLFRERSLKSLLIPSIPVFAAGCYLLWLSVGPRLEPSQPSILLSCLTPSIFFTNIIKCLNEDTFGLFATILAIPFALFWSLRKSQWLYIMIWLCGALLIDGLFGHTLWTARFQASLSTVGPWILSVALLYSAIEVQCSRFACSVWIHRVGFVVVWFFLLAPGFRLIPGSVFTTHSDIRMGRYVERSLPGNALIANIKPHGDYGKRYTEALSYNAVRGDCVRDTIFSRMGSHQIKYGNVVDRKLHYAAALSEPGNMPEKLAALGVTHILVLARPGVDAFVDRLGAHYVCRKGSTYLYSLK